MEFGSSTLITDLLEVFKGKAVEGIANLAPEAMAVMIILAVIELSVISILHFDSIKWQSYLGLILKFGFFAFLVVNWEDIAINQVFESFKTAGMVASGSSATTTPSAVVDTGIYLVSDVIASFSKISGWSAIMGSIGEILLKVVLCLVVIGCFGFIAIQIFLVTVEFYIVTALSVILLPFALTRYTSFLSEKVIGAVFSFGIKMMVLTFILGISIPLIQTWTYVEGKEMSELIKAAIGALTLAFLTVQVPALAQGFLSGSPSLDAGSAISSGRSAASAVSTGGASVMAKSMAGATMAGNRLQREAGMMSAAAGVSGGSIASGYARTALARGQQSLVNASSRANSLFDTYRNSRSEGSRYV